MAYEIPPPLQHKEKIIFGLTFVQLLYAGTSLIVITLIFNLRINVYFMWSLITIVVSIGVLFMFFDAKEWIKNFYHFIKFRSTNDDSLLMKHFIGISKLDKSFIYNNWNQKIAVLEVQPINFNIRTEIEQEAIIIGFQKLLNSLDFPIQLIITSESIKLQEHFDKLESKAKGKLDNLFQDYKNFIENSIKVDEIKNRKFYIIIKENNNIEIEIKLITEKINNIGLKVENVKEEKLLKKIHEYFNPYKYEKLKEGEVKDKQTTLISPKSIKNNIDHLEVNDCLNRIVTAVGYPNSVEKGFLDKIISGNDNYDISIHIDPFPIEFMLIQLNSELKKQRADLYSDEIKNIPNPSLEIKYAATRKTLEELQKGKQKLYNVSLYINCKTKPISTYKITKKELNKIINSKKQKELSKESYRKIIEKEIEKYQCNKALKELNLLTRKIYSELNSIMILSKTKEEKQISSLKS